MQPIADVITYPMESDEWMRTIIIGGILSFLGFLLIPLFLVYGYLMRVIRSATAGNPEPPTFGDWGELFVEGIKAFVIGLIYMLIPFIVLGVTVGSAVIALATGTDAGVAAGLSGLFVGLGLFFILALVFGYIAVAALVNFAREERFGAAFDVEVLKTVLFHREYAITWLVSVVIIVVASMIAGGLNLIPLLGAVIGAFVTFYAAIVAAALWTDGFANAVNQPITPEPTTAHE